MSRWIHIAKTYQKTQEGRVVAAKGTTYAVGRNAQKRAARRAAAAARQGRR